MPERVYNVLFLCTGNSARSILAESILRKGGAGRFRSFSAGSTPNGQANPFALRVLESLEYPTDGMRSKTWLEFAAPDAIAAFCALPVDGIDKLALGARLREIGRSEGSTTARSDVA